MAEQQDAREAELAGTVEACFLRLLHAQQVERVPSCDLPPPVDAARSAGSVGFCNLIKSPDVAGVCSEPWS